MYKLATACRSCGAAELSKLLYFGETPLADQLLKENELDSFEALIPLTLAICEECSLVQILEVVDPKILFFSEYPYFSSVSPSLQEHFKKSAKGLIRTRQLHGVFIWHGD
jgi:hypothetical protein